jgi:hypothetical protein
MHCKQFFLNLSLSLFSIELGMPIYFNCVCRTYLRSRRPVGDFVLVEVVVRVPDLAPERGGHGEEGREEPYEGDEDGVRPRSINQTLMH